MLDEVKYQLSLFAQKEVIIVLLVLALFVAAVALCA